MYSNINDINHNEKGINMLSYATIGVTDLEKSETFYNELLAPIGAKTLIKMERITISLLVTDCL